MHRFFLCALSIVLGTFSLFAEEADLVNPPATNLEKDEVLLFFPGYARFDVAQNQWRTNLHGNVHEPERGSSKRALLIGMLQAATKASLRLDDKHFLEDRVRPFLVDNEGGKRITVQIGNQRYALGVSESNGHFERQILLADEIPAPPPSGEIRSERVRGILPSGDERVFQGRIELIPPKGLSVISDIDDTIKASNVRDKTELIKNTFLRDFRDFEGMAELYTKLQDKNVAFHYVSGSVWQLYPPLSKFLAERGFPTGTFHLKHFRVKDGSVKKILASQNEYKLNAIRPILRDFPERRFVLIGDSGEQDPEIYGELAREYPNQVVGIFIRNVTDESAQHVRIQDAFQDVAAEKWKLFDHATDIEGPVQAMAAMQDSSPN